MTRSDCFYKSFSGPLLSEVLKRGDMTILIQGCPVYHGIRTGITSSEGVNDLERVRRSFRSDHITANGTTGFGPWKGISGGAELCPNY